ncbi:MAG: aldo/keto reductase [Bryobacteraceae bacterium]|jgi:predicted aldo/keto reductase-like oxidoreductase
MSISRRRFIESAAIATIGANAAAPTGMPMRTLGKTGARVSILAFGGGSRFLAYKDEEQALAALNHALDLGITYIDSAASYGDGLSEQRVGKVLKARGRNGLWLATKIEPRNGDEAMRTVERSLKNLQVDYVDLLHMHSLTTPEDLAAIEAKDGVLNRFYKLRDQKVARHIGITCHTDPAVLKTALERFDLDCTQMALNAARIGMAADVKYDNPATSFESLALPVAQRKNMGITAMKIFAQDKLTNKAATEKLIRYSMSLPVAATVIGMPKLDFINRNVETAKNFKPLSEQEMRDFSTELSGKFKASIDRYFAAHRDC